MNEVNAAWDRQMDKIRKELEKQPLKPFIIAEAGLQYIAPWCFIECDKTVGPLDEATCRQINEQWKQRILTGEPSAFVLPTGMKVKFPLPGNYAYSCKVGNTEVVYTFQTIAEMKSFIASSEETRD